MNICDQKATSRNLLRNKDLLCSSIKDFTQNFFFTTTWFWLLGCLVGNGTHGYESDTVHSWGLGESMHSLTPKASLL